MPAPVIYFDGVCNLCSSSVQFILKRDKKSLFRFAALQGNAGRQMLQEAGFNQVEPESVILQENGKIYAHSTAALKIARHLSGLWPLLYGFIIVPTFIRDGVYRYIARNRYRWFGKKEECWLPRPEWRVRFLD
jgi:predicted DCC family thiol-disulfide oxidoreductase YuxK